MNGRTARAIRKALKYEVRNEERPREYHTFSLMGWGNVMQYNTETGEVKTVRRRVEKFNVECVSGDRKVYQYMKKKYVNPNYVMDVNKFPEKSEIEELQNTIQSGMIEKEKAE